MKFTRGGCESRAGRKSALLVIVVALSVGASGILPAQMALSMSIQEEVLTVGGAVPGGSLVVFGVTHQTEDFHARLERVLEVVVDDDSDGTIQLEHKLLSLPTAVWIAVDLASGASGVAAGAPEFNPAPIAPPSLSLNAVGTAAIGIHLAGRGAVEGLWVRAGAGYWEISAVDGGAGEAEGEPDGDLDLPCTVFMDNPEAPEPPAFLVNEDVLALVDPWTLDWSVIRGSDLGLPEVQ
jgi:hypothetical protein